jgi:hypothetical protein
MTYWVINGKRMSNEEYMEMIRREEAEREQKRQEAAALLKRLTESYTELTEFMQQNPGIVQRVDSDPEQMQQTIYQKLRQNLTQADAAPRCAWIKNDGTGCGSPKMRQSSYCYAHMQMWETRPKKKRGWTALEDGNAIQMAIMEVQRALMDDEISEKRAGLMLYSLQIASANLARTTYGEKPEDMVTDSTPQSQNQALRGPRLDCVDAEEDDHAAEARRENKGLPLTNADGNREIGTLDHRSIEEQEAFIAVDANKGLPRMNTDETDRNRDRILPQSAIALLEDVSAASATAG